MGQCMSLTPEAAKDKQIEKMARKAQKKNETKVKVLLLGPGESGKSTIAKQVRLLRVNEFTAEERQQAKEAIHQNILHGLKTLVEGSEFFGYTIPTQLVEAAKLVANAPQNAFESDAVPEACVDLWKSEVIQKAWKRASELQLVESLSYFMDNMTRITSVNFQPTDIDMLHIRVKTTGVIDLSFTHEGREFSLVDVGGQRSERRKWLHCFNDVTAVLFCASMSEYDQMLYEDNTIRRTEETLKLWTEICQSKWFVDVTFILFLNKYDLFVEKIKTVDMKCAYPDYDGGCNEKNAAKFVKNKFAHLKSAGDPPYVHFTTATDRNSVKVAFDDAIKSIMLKKLEVDGFM